MSIEIEINCKKIIVAHVCSISILYCTCVRVLCIQCTRMYQCLERNCKNSLILRYSICSKEIPSTRHTSILLSYSNRGNLTNSAFSLSQFRSVRYSSARIVQNAAAASVATLVASARVRALRRPFPGGGAVVPGSDPVEHYAALLSRTGSRNAHSLLRRLPLVPVRCSSLFVLNLWSHVVTLQSCAPLGFVHR